MPHSLQVSYDMHTMRQQRENSNDGAGQRVYKRKYIKYLLLEESWLKHLKGTMRLIYIRQTFVQGLIDQEITKEQKSIK